MFNKFEEIIQNRHEHIKHLKASKDKRVIGYLCSYVPEELIYAAGAIPVRILSNEKLSTYADAVMQSHYCAFSRSILDQGLSGDYNYLDGLILAYSCNTMRFAYEAWEMHGSLPFSRFLYMPAMIDTPEARDHYVSELRRLRRDLEDLIGHAITDDDLRQSIEIYDTNRTLLTQLMEFRKQDLPLLWGKEAYLATISSMLTDKEQHNNLLKELLGQLPNRKDVPDASIRLMIVGSPVDNFRLLDVLEKQTGAIVVTDDTCTGTRYFRGTTPLAGNFDPIEAIADRYLISRTPCPQKYSPTRWTQCRSCPYRAIPCFFLSPKPKEDLPEDMLFGSPKRICRFRNIMQLAVSHHVQGALVIQQKFCDCHGLDYPHVAQIFKSIDVPTLFVEIENLASVAQLKVRIEAFIEMLEPESLWEEVV
jgi:benzoyl-CoA reductase subunit C